MLNREAVDVDANGNAAECIMRQGSYVKASVGRCRENQERKEESRNGKSGRGTIGASPIEMGDTSLAAEKNRSVARSN